LRILYFVIIIIIIINIIDYCWFFTTTTKVYRVYKMTGWVIMRYLMFKIELKFQALHLLCWTHCNIAWSDQMCRNLWTLKTKFTIMSNLNHPCIWLCVCVSVCMQITQRLSCCLPTKRTSLCQMHLQNLSRSFSF